MRKDSVNVFSEGLNYDLNPITTPNNVLTDCVNGTFLTFNGDELALQNDAGNTKISYQYSEVQADVFWTLDQAENIQPDFNWINLEVEHNKIAQFTTYTENTFQFLYVSVPQNSIITLYNEINIVLYDSTVADDNINQLFYLIGTMTTPYGATNDVYRKKDQFNTNNPVLFKIKVFLQGVEDGELQTEYVQLSEGYKPLGIKEEGGVLYIISGKKPVDTSSKWVTGTSYNKGQIVYNDTLIKTYYESIKEGVNTAPLPLESDENWFIVGTLEDYNNKYGYVEIGSYPSPEFGTLTDRPGKVTIYETSTINQELYNYRTINNEFFKTGRYVTFDGSVLNKEAGVENISRYKAVGEDLVWDPKFYIIKLYHQLNNGYLDITNDIWEKYKTYKGISGGEGEGIYWFDNDASFMYYCPNQYKGKLAMSVEIEEIQSFKLYGIPIVRFIPGTDPELDPDTFTLEIKVEAIGNGVMDINNVIVYTTLEGGTTVPAVLVAVLDNIATFVLTGITAENQGKIIEYEIIPEYSYGGNVIDNGDDITFLPKQYTDKYIILGKKVISTEYDVKFVEIQGDCDYNNSTRTQEVVALTNINEEYIDLTLTTVTEPFVYILQSLPLIERPADGTYTLISEYTISETGYPVLVGTPLTGSETINSLFSVYKVKQYSDTCSGLLLTINLNMKLRTCAFDFVRISQAGNYVQLTAAILNDENKPLDVIEFPLLPNYLVTVTAFMAGFEIINDSFYPTGNVTRNYGFIANVLPKYELSGLQTNPYSHYLLWEASAGTVQGSFRYLYMKSGEDSNYYVPLAMSKMILEGTTYCNYISEKRNVKNNNFVTGDIFTIENPNVLTTTYDNIPNNIYYSTKPARVYPCGTNCMEDSGVDYEDVDIIFRRTVDPRLMLGSVPSGFYINVTIILVSLGVDSSISGSFNVENTSYYPTQYNIYFAHGPLVDGTYHIDATNLYYIYNGVPLDTEISYKIDDGELMYRPAFDVQVSGSSVNVSIYVDQYNV